MNTVHINASRNYDVLIGNGLLASIGTYAVKLRKGNRACIVSDSNVWPLYGRIVEKSLECSGLNSVHFVIPAGESYGSTVEIDLGAAKALPHTSIC